MFLNSRAVLRRSVKFRSRVPTNQVGPLGHHCDARFLEANEVTLKWWQSACNKHWKVAMAGMNMLTAPCHGAVIFRDWF